MQKSSMDHRPSQFRQQRIPPGKIFGEAMHRRKEHGQVECEAQDQGGIDELRYSQASYAP